MCEGMRALRGVRRVQLRGVQRGSRVSRGSSYRPGAYVFFKERSLLAGEQVSKYDRPKAILVREGVQRGWRKLRSGQAGLRMGLSGNECGQRPKGMAALRRSRQEKGT